jgi:hypothetical protein
VFLWEILAKMTQVSDVAPGPLVSENSHMILNLLCDTCPVKCLKAIVTWFECFQIDVSDCQSINICANPENGQSCNITCDTTDFSQNVQFLLKGAVQGSCTVFGSTSVCGPGLSQSGTITTYSIPSLSRGTHEGAWSCSYGTSTSLPVSLVVKSEC